MNRLRRIPWAVCWALYGVFGAVVTVAALIAGVFATHAQDLGEKIRDEELKAAEAKGSYVRGKWN